MNRDDPRDLEILALRDRLSRLSEASLRINETLDLDAVLQGVIDSARSLAGATYGGISTIDEAGLDRDFVTSGVTPEEHERLAGTPDGPMFFQYLVELSTPLRTPTWSVTSGRWACPSSNLRCRPSPFWRPRCATGAGRGASSTWPMERTAGSSPPRTRRPW